MPVYNNRMCMRGRHGRCTAWYGPPASHDANASLTLAGHGRPGSSHTADQSARWPKFVSIKVHQAWTGNAPAQCSAVDASVESAASTRAPSLQSRATTCKSHVAQLHAGQGDTNVLTKRQLAMHSGRIHTHVLLLCQRGQVQLTDTASDNTCAPGCSRVSWQWSEHSCRLLCVH